MMESPTPLQYDSLRSAFRTANKLLKLWFAQHFPLSAKTSLTLGLATHQQYWQMIETLESLKSNGSQRSLESALSQLHISPSKKLEMIQFLKPFHKGQPLENQFLDDVINQLKQHQFGLIHSLHFSHCLYDDDKNDDELLAQMTDPIEEQKRLLKYISEAMQNINNVTNKDLIALFNLFGNIYRILLIIPTTQEKSNFLHHYQWLSSWMKLGAKIIDSKKKRYYAENTSSSSSKVSFTEIIFESFCAAIMLNHIVMAYAVVDNCCSDIDLMFAEHCVQTAMQLYRESIMHYARESLKNTIESKLLCLNAMMAYKNNYFEEFIEQIHNLKDAPGYCPILIDTWLLAGEYYKLKNPYLSLKFYKKAQTMLKRECTTQETCKMSEDLAKVEKICQEIENTIIKDLRKSLRDLFPNIKIKSGVTNTELLLFVPLDAIPHHYQKKLSLLKPKHFTVKVVDNVDRQGNPVRGLQILTHSLYSDKILHSLSKCVNAFKQVSQMREAQTENSYCEIGKLPIEHHAKSLKEEPEAPYLKAPERKKEKSRKAAIIPPSLQPPSLPTTKECHAEDFGFTVCKNDLVTPVYFSEAAQKMRRPKLFIRYKGIPGVEETIENLFKEMLNPYLEGIRTVGMVNQSGAKIWKHPDNLGDRWHLCALRFKRKGAAGWLRAIAEPEQKITITHEDGSTENRYLFSLGRPKHK